MTVFRDFTFHAAGPQVNAVVSGRSMRVGNRQARELELKQADEADWQRVRTEPRPATSDVHARGIGQLRLQVIVCPSFEEARGWEVRQQGEKWSLFCPRVVRPWPDVQMVGYDKLPFPSDRLQSFFRQVVSITIPIEPDLSGHGGADGTVYQLALIGDLYSELRFQWWSDSPKAWQPLVTIVGEMIQAFRLLKELWLRAIKGNPQSRGAAAIQPRCT